MHWIMISVTSISRPAKEYGPITPANTGRSGLEAATWRTASTSMAHLDVFQSGTCSRLASSALRTTGVSTTGTSFSSKRTDAPNACASTERSILDTIARCLGKQRMISSIPRAWFSLDSSSSRTLIPIFFATGNDKMSKPLGFPAIISAFHLLAQNSILTTSPVSL